MPFFEIEQRTTVQRIPDLGGPILTYGGQPRPVRRPAHAPAFDGQHFPFTDQLPYLCRSIKTACRPPLAIRLPGDGSHHSRMSFEEEKFPAVSRVPHPRRAIPASCRQPFAIRRPAHATNHAHMAFEGEQFLAISCLPNLRCGILT